MNRRLFATAALVLTLPASAMAEDLIKAPRMGNWGFDLAGRDTTVSPGDSFYDYANGSYVAKLEIPPDRARYGAFDRLNDLSQARMRAVLEGAAEDKAANGERAKIGAFYRSFMDEAAVNAAGARPLASGLAAIRKATTRSDLARLMGQSVHAFGGSFFGASIYDDAKSPLRYAVYLEQGGLGLPDRDYYLQPNFAPQKAAYEAYVAKLLSLTGWPNAQAEAKAIVAMETEIAKVSWTRAESRDDEKTYNPVETAKLSDFAPGFDWKAFLDGAEIGQAQRVIAQQNTAFPKIAAIYARTPVNTLKAWAAFNLADNAAPYLSKDFERANYEFRS
jgi:putative endopeptidase